MSYRFCSKAWGDVLVLQPVGDRLLAAMGLARAPRGLIAPAAIPAVLTALQAAIAHDEQHGVQHGAEAAPLDDVRLRQRAWPLVEMLKAAAGQQEAIVWGV